MIKIQREKTFTFSFTLLCLFVFIEYSRPDFILFLRPALVIQILLIYQLLKNLKSVRETVGERYFILFGILLLEMIIHGPIAANNYYALMTFLKMLSLLLLSISIVVFADSPSKINILLLAIVAGHLLAATRFTPLNLSVGVTGIMGDTNDFALSMNFVIPISFYLSTLTKGIRRVALLGTTAIFVMANVVTSSRGGFLGMVTVGIFCFLSTKHKFRSLAVLLTIGVIFFLLIPGTYKEEMMTIQDEIAGTYGETPPSIGKKSSTGRDRLELWKVGMRAFADHPVLGVGQGNLPRVIGSYQDMETDIWGRGIGGRSTHSMYIEIIAELGVVGATIFLLMLLNLYNKYRIVIEGTHPLMPDIPQEPASHDSVVYMKALMVSMVGVLVTAAFLSVFYYTQHWLIFALATAVLAVNRKQSVGSPQPIGSTAAEASA